MNNRFAPDIPKLRRVFEHLKTSLAHYYPNADKLWVEACSAVTGANSKSMSGNDARNILWAIMTSREEVEIPWEFYNMVSELIKPLPLAIKDTIIKGIKIGTGDAETGESFEYLQISPDGHWQIMWEVNPDEEIGYREVGFDWYIPPDQASFPLVPNSIIDCIAGCILLLRKNLVLPAASILSIALEAALWEALEVKGVSRSTEQKIYAAVEWHLKRFHDKLLVSIEGADENVQALGALFEPGQILSFELRRSREDSSNGLVQLNMSVDKSLVKFWLQSRKKRQL